MSAEAVDRIVRAVLYEGHMLYPYRPSAVKNRRRFTFGRVYPRAYSRLQEGKERYTMSTECLVVKASEEEVASVPAGASAASGASGTSKDLEIEISVRFLQPLKRQVLDAAGGSLDQLDVEGTTHWTWHDVVERNVQLPTTTLRQSDIYAAPFRYDHFFAFSESTDREELMEGDALRGTIERYGERIEGVIHLTVDSKDGHLFTVRVDVANESACPADAGADEDRLMLYTLASTHTVLHVRGGRFLSLIDPPAEHVQAVASCTNDGTWPVLVGEPGRADTLLSSPIILYDYPEIAPESAGDLFDSTEIDEILTLRIMTMTDGEKNEMRSVDEFARRILHRTEQLEQDDMMAMHGTFRDLRSLADEEAPRFAYVKGRRMEVGDRVRIRPSGRSDVMDMALNGRTAEIESIDQDFEGRIYLALVVDDDPGRDLGLMRQPGHRFFYSTNEVEPLEEERHDG